MGRVDCDVEVGIGKRFQISKYPTLKISLNGDIMKTEYRGQRSPEALAEFVNEQLKDPIKEIINLNELKLISPKLRYVIAYFDQRNTDAYHIYRRSAANLKEFCNFYAGFGETVSEVHAGGVCVKMSRCGIICVCKIHSTINSITLYRSSDNHFPTGYRNVSSTRRDLQWKHSCR